ncbi:Uncharacterized protein Fot_07882 [Forsythia ovata]|uniref:Uncharacterized protein n=1 Tax=Forsythia ovata TaxID=205694 RepID=A0ABD1WX26_9LAMI
MAIENIRKFHIQRENVDWDSILPEGSEKTGTTVHRQASTPPPAATAPMVFCPDGKGGSKALMHGISSKVDFVDECVILGDISRQQLTLELQSKAILQNPLSCQTCSETLFNLTRFCQEEQELSLAAQQREQILERFFDVNLSKGRLKLVPSISILRLFKKWMLSTFDMYVQEHVVVAQDAEDVVLHPATCQKWREAWRNTPQTLSITFK